MNIEEQNLMNNNFDNFDNFEIPVERSLEQNNIRARIRSKVSKDSHDYVIDYSYCESVTDRRLNSDINSKRLSRELFSSERFEEAEKYIYEYWL